MEWNYIEQVQTLTSKSRLELLEVIVTDAKFRKVVEDAVSIQRVPITITLKCQDVQFPVGSMNDLKLLEETLKREVCDE